MASGFKGFSQDSLTFLQEIRKQNSKEWFDEHREVYDSQLILPFRQLVEALTPNMLLIDDCFETRPAIGKTISRIHRDTRFSNDKTRYRSRLWLTFKRPSNDWKEAPSYFFELSPDMYRYGMGYYCAPRQKMDRFRAAIDQNTKAFSKAIRFFKPPFELAGESYKRSLNKNLPEDIATWYNRKSFAVMNSCPFIEETFSAGLVDTLIKGFDQIAPLYHYLMKLEAKLAEPI